MSSVLTYAHPLPIVAVICDVNTATPGNPVASYYNPTTGLFDATFDPTKHTVMFQRPSTVFPNWQVLATIPWGSMARQSVVMNVFTYDVTTGRQVDQIDTLPRNILMTLYGQV